MDARSHSSWLAWQVVDSAFPTGAFAHSWGLEAAWQQGEVPDVAALAQFLSDSITQAGYGTLPLLNTAYRDPRQLAQLDERADAFLLNAVANRASRQQGRTLLATAMRVWPSPTLVAMENGSRDACAHLAPLSGAVFRAIGLPLTTAQRVVLYSAARGVLTAAVRLGIAGGYESQQLQANCAPTLDAVSRACAALDIDDLAQTAPLVDILQGGHDRLYSRLFQS
jgi:urease accessory protein